MAVLDDLAVGDLDVLEDFELIIDDSEDLESSGEADGEKKAAGMLYNRMLTRETDRGSSAKLYEISPFFSYPSMSKKFQILTVLSSAQEAISCFVTERVRELIFLLWKPQEKNWSMDEMSASIRLVLI